MKSLRRSKSSSRKDFKRTGASRFRRARVLETLEGRVLLAGDTSAALAPFHNRYNGRDVNFDHRVSAVDALYVINDLLTNGPRTLPQIAQPLAAGGNSGFRYIDVTGDNQATPRDALIVVNSLLATTLMDVKTNILDLGGNPITQINVGEDFLIEVEVQDTRDPVSATPGVFSAFVDMLYDNGLVTVAAQIPDYGPDFQGVTNQQIDVSTPGFIPGFLSISGLSPRPNNNVQQLWTIVAHASAAGTAVFSPAFDNTPGHDMLLYPDVSLTETDIFFEGSTLTILGGDPTVSIAGAVQQSEGNSGTTAFVFEVTLSAPSASEVTVEYFSQDGTASENSDYFPVSGTLTFSPGLTQQLLTVLVNGDITVEDDETFVLGLFNSVGAVIGNGTGQGTIINDDNVPTLAIGPVSQAEGNAGNTNFVFTATLSAPTGGPVVVAFSTFDNTALTANNDYVGTSGTLTFAAGETSKLITVQVVGDATTEPNETFGVGLARISGSLANENAVAVGTILNDEGQRVVIRLEVTDNAGVPLPPGTVLNPNDTFQLRAYAQDIQTTPAGIAQVFLDATYDPNLVVLDGAISFGSSFPNGRTADTNTPGLLNEVGAFGDLGQPAVPGAPVLFFTAPFRVLATGLATFGVEPADLTDHDVRIYLDDNPVANENINFVGTQLLLGGNMSVLDNSVLEGNAGTTNLVFTVNRIPLDNSAATVTFATSNGTAGTGDGDYVGTSGTLSFAPGETSKQITVVINGDTKNELDEAFTLTLSNANGATLARSVATGTILNDDGVPFVSIGNAAGNEGTSLTFTATLSAASGLVVTVPYSTAGGSAGSGTDFGPASGTLTFQPGETSKTVSVLAFNDLLLDPAETFSVNLGSATNAIVDQGTGTGTIGDVVPTPTLSVAPVLQAEGNAGTTNFVFTATLSSITTAPVLVTFSTSDGSASSASDYAATSGTVTFLPGETSKLITVAVSGDTLLENSETFTLSLSGTGPVVVNPSPLHVLGTILNDDGSRLSVNDVSAVGLPSAITFAVFTVTLSSGAAEPVTVGYATQDNTAVAGQDYVLQSGILTFEPGGPLTQTVSVPILPQANPTADETFFLTLSSPSSNAQIDDGTGVATIVRQGISVNSFTITEGDAGTKNAVFTLSLSAQRATEVTVNFDTVNGTATTANNDYVATSGVATFAPGATTTTVTVMVNGDTVVEDNETFTLHLSLPVPNPSGVPLIVGDGVATIINDDGQQVLIRAQIVDSDGNDVPTGGSLDLDENFTLQVYVQDVRNNAAGVYQAFLDLVYSSQLVQVTGPIQFNSALFPNGQQGTVTTGLLDEVGAFAGGLPPAEPGAEQLFFSIPMKTINYGVASFTPSAADLADHDVLIYLSDDPVPIGAVNFTGTSVSVGSNVVTVSDVQLAEGNSGTKDFIFTLTRILPNGGPAIVTYTTLDGTATTDDDDYEATNGTVTFGAEETTKTVTVKVVGDLKSENNETFKLSLVSAINATLAVDGTGTIQDDDEFPSLAIGSASASEGQLLVFTVTLSAVSGREVTVNYHTEPGTATSGADYNPISGVLTFSPGQTTRTLTVQALGDTKTEPTETFQLVLTSPANATLANGSGQGAIIDIPPASLSGYVYVDLNNNGLKDANETGLGNVIVLAQHSSGFAKSVLTNPDGSYFIDELIAGNYTLTETHPAFFIDGRDTRFGVDSALNDVFTGINLSPSEHESGYNFGERSLRAEFALAFMNRRAFFASAIVTGEWGGQIGTTGAVNPKLGDVWISFDAGWVGTRTIDAIFAANQGAVSMTLYNNNLQAVATSFAIDGGHSQLIYSGSSNSPLFLKISGNNDQVTISVTPPVQNAAFQASQAGGYVPGGNLSGLLASSASAPSATPQSSPSATDLVWAEDEDWLD